MSCEARLTLLPFEDLNAFYREATGQVRAFCEENGIECHIKKGTAD